MGTKAKQWLNDEVEILLDFTGDLYRHPDECLRNGNTIDYNAGIVLPWSKRSDLSGEVKERMRMIIGSINPPLYFQRDNKVEWYLNLSDYPRLESAAIAINEAGVWEPSYAYGR